MIYVEKNNNRQEHTGIRNTKVRKGSNIFYEQVCQNPAYDARRNPF